MQKQLAIKILIIFVVGLFVFIPINMVGSKVYERQRFMEQAKQSVATSWTGAQSLYTPVLIVPYRITIAPASGFYKDDEKRVSEKISVVLPNQLNNQVTVVNKSLYRGIYEIPIYTSDLTLTGEIRSEKIKQHINRIKSLPGFLGLDSPYLSLHVSDVRGIDGVPSLAVNNNAVTLSPGSKLKMLVGGLNADVQAQLANEEDIRFSMALSLHGMDSLSFVHLADDATTHMQSDWPHPEFTGVSLPVDREISAMGFSANWSSTRYSSDNADLLEKCLNENSCDQLKYVTSGVSFIEPVDIYLQSERSIKYAILFVGLSFIAFFIFEHSKKIRIHPIQYAFVGFAIAVFYLLLLSLAEHIAFHWAYFIAVVACVSLLQFYVRYLLKRVILAGLFSLMLLALFGLLYVIVQAEDFALLMGTSLVFAVLVVLMYVTRNIDWYSLSAAELD